MTLTEFVSKTSQSRASRLMNMSQPGLWRIVTQTDRGDKIQAEQLEDGRVQFVERRMIGEPFVMPRL